MQRENLELQQRAASTAAPSYPPASMQNTAFFEKEIQRMKQEKKKVEDEKRVIEEEKRKLETEISSLRTGQYGKQMPNFSGGPQERFKARIKTKKCFLDLTIPSRINFKRSLKI